MVNIVTNNELGNILVHFMNARCVCSGNPPVEVALEVVGRTKKVIIEKRDPASEQNAEEPLVSFHSFCLHLWFASSDKENDTLL
jgi:hypothetical protein